MLDQHGDHRREATVLDLFAGSGALGIEALSRGAAAATFVERDRAAVAAIRANLAVVGAGPDRATVVCADALRYVATARPVDVTFADPPYRVRGLAGATRPRSAGPHRPPRRRDG